MAYQDYYYKTGFGGTVPIVSQADYDKVVAAGFTPFKQGSAETTTTQSTQPTQPAPTMNTSQPPQGATRVGPTEYNQLRQQYGVSPTNFDQYFWRDPNSSDIYKLSGLASATPAMDEEVDVSRGTSATLSGTDSVYDYTSQVAGDAMTAFEKAILQLQQEQTRVTEEQRRREEEQRDAARLGLEEAYNGPSQLELYRQFEEEVGLRAKEEALTNIMNQIGEIRQAAMQEQNLLNASPYSTQFIMGRNRQITDKANADMAGLISAGEIIQNNIDAAERRIANYYNAAIVDRENEIERRTMLYNLEANDVIQLDEKEREANQNAIDMLRSINERQMAEKDAVTALMLQYPEAWAAAAGKLDLTAGYNDIAQQLVPYINQVNAAPTGGGGGSTAGAYKLSSADRNMLIGMGFTTTDLANFEANINAGYSVDDIINRAQFAQGPVPADKMPYSNEQINALRSIFPQAKGIKDAQYYINDIINTLTRDDKGKIIGGKYIKFRTIKTAVDRNKNTGAIIYKEEEKPYIDYTNIPPELVEQVRQELIDRKVIK